MAERRDKPINSYSVTVFPPKNEFGKQEVFFATIPVKRNGETAYTVGQVEDAISRRILSGERVPLFGNLELYRGDLKPVDTTVYIQPHDPHQRGRPQGSKTDVSYETESGNHTIDSESKIGTISEETRRKRRAYQKAYHHRKNPNAAYRRRKPDQVLQENIDEALI